MPSAFLAELRALEGRIDRLTWIRLGASGLALGSALGGLGAVAGRLFGALSPAAGHLAFAAAGGAGLLAGLLAAARRRVGAAGAALWLDARLGRHELALAALSVAARSPDAGGGAAAGPRGSAGRPGAPGRFDALVLAEAESLAQRMRGEGPDPRRLLLPLGLAALALLGGLLALALVSPLRGAGLPGLARVLAEAGAREESFAPPSLAEQRRAAALAKSLFPDNPELAARATESLARGRLSELGALLERAERELSEKLGQERRPLSERKLREDLERLEAASDELGDRQSTRRRDSDQAAAEDEGDGTSGEGEGEAGREGGEGSGGEGQGPGDSDGGGQGEAEDGAGSGDSRDAPGEAEPSEGDGEGAGAARPEANPVEGGTLGPGSAPPGTGSSTPGSASSGLLRGAARLPRADGGRLEIAPDPGAAFFEQSLPGVEPGPALERAIAEAARAAEEAVRREDLPLEHREALRAYFTELAAEAARLKGSRR